MTSQFGDTHLKNDTGRIDIDMYRNVWAWWDAVVIGSAQCRDAMDQSVGATTRLHSQGHAHLQQIPLSWPKTGYEAPVLSLLTIKNFDKIKVGIDIELINCIWITI